MLSMLAWQAVFHTGLGLAENPSLAELKRTVTTQAQIMAESGADLLMLEMMIDVEQMMVTYEAAKSSGLPHLGWAHLRT